MRAGVRKLLLFGSLGAIVAFLAWDRPERGASVVGPATPGAASAQPKVADSLQFPDRSGLARSRGELFGAPPPPPQQVVATPVAAAPVAPPVPYRFAGMVLKGSEAEFMVTKGDLVFPVKVGDTLDGMYRVESIGAEGIELLYLPLGTKDRIVVSSVFDAGNATPVVAGGPAAVAESAAIQKSDGKPAQLRWEGPGQVQAGASFSVALRVSTQEPLRAAPMQLRFEPEVLEAVNVRPGKFFGKGSFSYRVNAEGSIFVGATSEPVAPGADAELVIVTFKPLKRGATAELNMSALSLQGEAGRAISHERVTSFRTAIQ